MDYGFKKLVGKIYQKHGFEIEARLNSNNRWIINWYSGMPDDLDFLFGRDYRWKMVVDAAACDNFEDKYSYTEEELDNHINKAFDDLWFCTTYGVLPSADYWQALDKATA